MSDETDTFGYGEERTRQSTKLPLDMELESRRGLLPEAFMRLSHRWLVFGTCLLLGGCLAPPPYPDSLIAQVIAKNGDRPHSDDDGDGIPLVRDHCPNTPPGAAVDNRGCALDSDRDGVLDKDDLCPNTPYGVPVDATGCPLDSDGDGVPDSLDLCPNTPRGVKVDANGCPLDSDGDGVPDYLDACPGTPAGAVVDARGCWIVPNLHFASGSWTIPADAHAGLRDVIAILKREAGLNVILQGHTDHVGGATYNQGLSEKRARAVRDFFIAQGIAAERLEAVGFGLTQPVASNDSEEGRAQNRRVVVDIPSQRQQSPAAAPTTPAASVPPATAATPSVTTPVTVSTPPVAAATPSATTSATLPAATTTPPAATSATPATTPTVPTAAAPASPITPDPASPSVVTATPPPVP